MLGKFVENGVRPVPQNGRLFSVGSLVVFVQVGGERFFRCPDSAVRVAFQVVQSGEVKQVGHGKHPRLEQKVVSSAGVRGDEEHAKGRGFGVLDGKPKAAREGESDVFAETVVVVIGDVGEKFVRELFGGFGGHVHFEKETGVALAFRVRDVEAVGVQGESPLGLLAGLLVGLRENHVAGNVGVAGAGAKPERETGGLGIQGGIEIGDGEFVAEGVLGERCAVFDVCLVIAQGFVEVGAFGSFQFGENRFEVFGFQVPHGGGFGEGGAFGGSDGDPIAPDETQGVQTAQDVGEVFDAGEFFALRGEGAVNLFGRHQAEPRDGFEDDEIERGEGGVHGGGFYL